MEVDTILSLTWQLASCGKCHALFTLHDPCDACDPCDPCLSALGAAPEIFSGIDGMWRCEKIGGFCGWMSLLSAMQGSLLCFCFTWPFFTPKILPNDFLPARWLASVFASEITSTKVPSTAARCKAAEASWLRCQTNPLKKSTMEEKLIFRPLHMLVDTPPHKSNVRIHTTHGEAQDGLMRFRRMAPKLSVRRHARLQCYCQNLVKNQTFP